jgi:hypothetical protein
MDQLDDVAVVPFEHRTRSLRRSAYPDERHRIPRGR